MSRRIVFSSPGNEDSIPSTVEEIFTDYKGRRLGFLRAFFRDVDEFYASCDPERRNLSLYAHPNRSWEVDEPPLDLVMNLPEPVVGINFARDGMRRQDWLGLVSVHSDLWLLSLASFFSALLSRDERIRLFNMINDLPTLFEQVTKYHPR